jgi:L-ascorbate metabolism protein UlaG (beta-lactamase superfamily)
MTITWLGQNCFKIEGKQATLVIDPIIGSRMPKVGADILIVPRSAAKGERVDAGFLKAPAFTIESPGEFEAKGVLVEGKVFGEKSLIVFRFEVEGVRFGHLSSASKKDDDAISFLESVDVLFLPVGGGEVLSPADAVDVVSSVEPRLVIPMNFRESSAPSLLPVEKFCQAMGLKQIEPQQKFSFTKKDLPNEETRLVILEA